MSQQLLQVVLSADERQRSYRFRWFFNWITIGEVAEAIARQDTKIITN